MKNLKLDNKSMLLVLILALLSAQGGASSSENLYKNGITVAGTVFEFILNKKFDIFVSKNCEHNECNVLTLLSHLKQQDITNNDDEDYANPGRSICLSNNGEIVRGKTKDGDEIALCSFSDKSLISLSSLYKIAVQGARK